MVLEASSVINSSSCDYPRGANEPRRATAQNARLPVSSTKRKNPEGVAEASASAQVSHRRVMQLVVPIEQMIFEAGAGDDARTGKILAELQKSLAIAIHAVVDRR